MKPTRAVLILVLLAGRVSAANPQENSAPVQNKTSPNAAQAQAASTTVGKKFDNQYLTMIIPSGWTVGASTDQKLNLIHAKYLLTINPIFVHASGVQGGRFSEIVGGLPSIDAVMANVDQLAGAFECAQTTKGEFITKRISFSHLYTDNSKTENGCKFPSSGHSVWFGSFFSGEGSEGEYTITLSYDTTDVNNLPEKGSPQLKRTLNDVDGMLKSLDLKPAVRIARLVPPSAPPGTFVTIYGSGFYVPGLTASVRFNAFPNNFMPPTLVRDDGKWLQFTVPTSIDVMSCEAGKINVGESCVPAPANHVGQNDCPPKSDGSTNFCGAPIIPATYQISVNLESSIVSTKPVAFTITAPKPTPVSISLLYPNKFAVPGEIITVRGHGFTTNGNTVKIGAAEVNDVSSSDGQTLTFQAPDPSRGSLYPSLKIYKAFISNANGESNSITFEYR